MIKKNIVKIILTLLLIAIIPATVFLVKKIQEIRRGAYFASAKAWFLPTTAGPKNIGDLLPVFLVADLADKKMIGFTAKVTYSKDKLELASDNDVFIHSAFSTVIQKKVDQAEGAVYLSAVAMDGVSGILGIDNPLVKFNFKVKALGAGTIELINDKTQYSQYQVVGETETADKEIELKNESGGKEIKITYSLGPAPTATIKPTATSTPRVTSTPTATKTPTPIPGQSCSTASDCVWCGTDCIKKGTVRSCLDVMPPAGSQCLCVNSQCKKVTPTPTSVSKQCSVNADCKWCGTSCVKKDYKGVCLDVMPPSDKECVCQSGSCAVRSRVSACPAGSECMDRATCPPGWVKTGTCSLGNQVLGINSSSETAAGICCRQGTGTITPGPTSGADTPPPTGGPTKTPVPSPISPGTPILNFKIGLVGIAGNARAIQDVQEKTQKLVIKAVRGSFEKEFKDVSAVMNDQGVFSGQLSLDGVAPADGYTIFVKGPLHLMKKYCLNNQRARCATVEGNITLVAGEGNNYDFSALPLEVGDTPNPLEAMRQDDRVDSSDFARVKARLGMVDPAELLVADLDFNGVVNSRDLVLLLQTLSEKPGENY